MRLINFGSCGVQAPSSRAHSDRAALIPKGSQNKMQQHFPERTREGFSIPHEKNILFRLQSVTTAGPSLSVPALVTTSCAEMSNVR